jgi:hypothetical protein
VKPHSLFRISPAKRFQLRVFADVELGQEVHQVEDVGHERDVKA